MLDSTGLRSLRRRRTLGEIIGDSLGVYKSPPLLFTLLILGLPTGGYNVLMLAIQLNTDSLLFGLISFPLSFVAGAVLGTGAIYALDQLDRGTRFGPGTAILAAVRRLDALLPAAWYVLFGVVIRAITIIGIPWAIAKGVSWYFTHQAIMVDGQDGDSALDYSADLVAGHGWMVFGYLIALGILTSVVVFIPWLLLATALDDLTAGICDAAIQLLVFPFGVTSSLLIYYDLRLRIGPAA